eukprot:CAMPEP_0174857260 /NCGR_PEP_ID=MMETSP1114-20130205/38214_1 /TAXON_ID=312471 /ORGANISM="Neobodo designis, Strain CCAP 1951/1" /LENGTH=92 /DNA_ID=CAMNT_0016092101 /DNA_START=72 /DNA_END=346 /DNA_ORIENTATION=-
MEDPFGDDSFDAAPLDKGDRASQQAPLPQSASSRSPNTAVEGSPTGAINGPFEATSNGGASQPDDAEWAEECGEYDRPAVGTTMLVTGPASR